MTPVAFADRWRQAVAAVPDRTFLVWEGPDGSTATWTYREFHHLVERTMGELQRHGLVPGEAVHLALANSPAFVAVWLAAIQMGAWVVPSDPQATTRELDVHMQRTRPLVGVCARARAHVYQPAAVGMHVIEVDEDDTDLDVFGGGPRRSSHVSPSDRAAVMFTSGTTSAPKGVEVTQANYAFAGDVMAAAAGLTQHDRQLVVLPMFHANAQYYSFASAISAGASVALVHAFSASRFLEQAARHQATHASLFAAPMRMILAKQPAPEPGLRLRHCWYAQNVTDAQYEELAGLLGCRPRQLYGMTETMPAVLSNRALDPVPGAMGFPTLGCRVRLSAAGEIEVGGERGVHLLQGYLDDPVTTAASFTEDGWFRTGDRATLDEEGRYLFGGRGADILKVSGENVSTVEIEAVLSAHPSVLEAAVVGEPDPVRDEVPVGYVVQQPGAPPIDVAELEAWCTQRLSKVKRPRRIEVVDELPRTSVGKIRKFLLAQPPP